MMNTFQKSAVTFANKAMLSQTPKTLSVCNAALSAVVENCGLDHLYNGTTKFFRLEAFFKSEIVQLLPSPKVSES